MTTQPLPAAGSPFAPTEAQHFKARYKTWIGITMLVIGVIATVLNVWVMLLSGSFSFTIIPCVLPAIIGFLYLTRPYFVVAPNRLTIYSPIGQVVKRYPFKSFNDIKLVNDRLYIESVDANLTGAEQVKISKGLTHAQDWQTLEGFTQSEA
ncbi:MAG: hypothetical protein AAGC93_09215 [Cyanobacteria bacterium P01_F01_bin.53]